MKSIQYISIDIVKYLIKKIVYNVSFLRSLFIILYKLGGRRPWSIGYSIYKYTAIKETIDQHLEIFYRNSLPAQFGFRMDGRIVEYPWFFSRLKDEAVYLLDAGSTLNQRDILSVKKLRNRKLYITTLAYEGIPRMDGLPSYIFEDLRDMCYKPDFFDAVVCISTLEHVGMDNTFLYTSDMNKKENDTRAYLGAMTELKRVLKKGGTLYLTVPYGRYRNYRWFQVFDAKMIEKAIQAFSPMKISVTYFKYAQDQWNFSNEESCRDGYVFDIRKELRGNDAGLTSAQCVACLEMVK